MSASTDVPRRLTVTDIARRYAEGQRLATVTAYDYPTAQIVDAAGIPLILVGDSLGQVALGYESTVRVTMDEMLHHTKAVVRGSQRALIVGDMPFLSYASVDEALDNAGRFLQEAGCQAVKVEGGVRSARVIEAWSRRASRSWATSAGRRRRSTASAARSRSRARTAVPRGRCSPTRTPSRRLAPSRSCSSSCRRNSPRRSPRGCASRRSGSAPDPAAAARSRSSPTCWAWATSCRATPRRSPTFAACIADAMTRYIADVETGAFPGEAQTVRMDGRVLDEVLGRGDADRPAGSMPVGGIPLDRDL